MEEILGLIWKKDYLDFVLVPCCLLIMLGYHVLHLNRCIKLPQTTVIGYENYNKKIWVQRILEIEAKERGQAVAVMGANIYAATSLASISLALSSLMGTWIGSSNHYDLITNKIYGNTSPRTTSREQTTMRGFIHANFLISIPNCQIPVADVENAVIKASNFWIVGLRSLYFATNLLLWIFGPIPMFLCSVIMVVMLHFLDSNSAPMPQYTTSATNGHLEKFDKETSDEVTENHGKHE
ncbi:hypothetical protein F511_08549 [Dorcoceras hygrometricum]|uniref:Uncharacterized protein n=1 Tax=Dorcoceras hygrometricum TaxID=472368 RepID=A0A2Z7D585_9LAMI|nr:hypothetical protein F511_08549 [Dorcoceras hygrometricum]